MPKKILDGFKKNRKIIIPVLIIILVAAVIFGKKSLGQKSANTNQTKTETVARKDLQFTVSASGAVEGEKEASLHFQSPGKVAWVGVTEGKEIKKGQALAQLDTTQLSANLQIARSNLRAAEATLDRVYDNVKGHENDESFNQKEARTAAETAKDKAYDAVLSAQDALKNSTLIAPFNGVVISISDNITPGANAALTDAIVIADVSKFKFVAQVDEVDYGQIALDQKVKISLDAFPDETFEGTVTNIGKAGIKTASGGVTIPVEIRFDSKGKNIAIGLSGDADFIVEERKNVLVLPKNYLESQNDENKVFILENGKTVEKKVTIGLSTLTEVEIVEGLEEGQEVILPKTK